MKKTFLVIFCLTGLSLFAQTNAAQVAPGAREQLDTLLNNPAMVQPAGITPQGRHWFRLETDAHVITNEAGFGQVAGVLDDWENTSKIFHGKISRLQEKIISRDGDDTIIDFTMISFAPLGIQIKTPYRTAVRTVEKSESKIHVEMRQLASDSASNKDIKNLFAVRYAEKITIAGTPYTYIRIYAIDDVNTSILPGARGILEKNAAPSNIEALQLIIAAAKAR